MSKKISKNRKSKSGDKTRSKKQLHLDREAKNLQLDILRLLSEESDQYLTFRNIIQFFQDQGWPKKSIEEAIGQLLHDRLLTQSGKQKLQISNKAPIYQGVINQNPRGFGFVTPTLTPPGRPKLSKDIFIPLRAMGAAHHGDTVSVFLTAKTSKERSEGAVLHIIAKAHPVITGIVQRQNNNLIVVPDDSRFPFFVTVDNPQLDVPTGNAVVIEYHRQRLSGRSVPGTIVEDLGPYRRMDVLMRLITEKFSLRSTFSEAVLQETARLEQPSEIDRERLDLRDTQHITIDGADAKDFDDAIYVQKTRSGYRLHVSIADVSHFVKTGSKLDQEAFQRGTSIYFPGRVLPMLPEKLSNNLCSLVPDEDRLCVTAILDVDRQGKIRQQRFARSIIRSRQRFTYDTVYAIVGRKDTATRKKYKDFCLQLKWAFELAEIFRDNRLASGSIDFNLPEPYFTLTAEGEISSITRRDRNSAHQLIEEFMLAANQAVARFLEQQQLPAIFRIHEAPDEMKIKPFLDFAKTLDLPLPPFTNTSSWFARLLDNCRGKQAEYVLNNLILRLMQQARYSSDNLGHFGLAMSHYVHFTSPIRRYPDLMIHRLLLHAINQNHGESKIAGYKKTTKDAIFLSQKERDAISAERDIHDRLKAIYMEQHLGEKFSVIVSQVSDTNLYVEIQEWCVSGSIDIELFGDDYYIYDEKRYRLVGEIQGRIIQIGDMIEAELIGVDLPSKRIFFRPVRPETRQ